MQNCIYLWVLYQIGRHKKSHIDYKNIVSHHVIYNSTIPYNTCYGILSWVPWHGNIAGKITEHVRHVVIIGSAVAMTWPLCEQIDFCKCVLPIMHSKFPGCMSVIYTTMQKLIFA